MNAQSRGRRERDYFSRFIILILVYARRETIFYFITPFFFLKKKNSKYWRTIYKLKPIHLDEQQTYYKAQYSTLY